MYGLGKYLNIFLPLNNLTYNESLILIILHSEMKAANQNSTFGVPNQKIFTCSNGNKVGPTRIVLTCDLNI